MSLRHTRHSRDGARPNTEVLTDVPVNNILGIIFYYSRLTQLLLLTSAMMFSRVAHSASDKRASHRPPQCHSCNMIRPSRSAVARTLSPRLRTRIPTDTALASPAPLAPLRAPPRALDRDGSERAERYAPSGRDAHARGCRTDILS